MLRTFTLDYWLDEGWYVGRLREAPEIFSQGQTPDELEANIKDAFALMAEDETFIPSRDLRSRKLQVEIS